MDYYIVGVKFISMAYIIIIITFYYNNSKNSFLDMLRIADLDWFYKIELYYYL